MMTVKEEAEITRVLETALNDLKNSKTLKIKHKGVEKDIKDMTPEERAKFKATVDTLKQAWLDADYLEITKNEDGGITFSPKKNEHSTKEER